MYFGQNLCLWLCAPCQSVLAASSTSRGGEPGCAHTEAEDGLSSQGSEFWAAPQWLWFPVGMVVNKAASGLVNEVGDFSVSIVNSRRFIF